MLKPCVITEYVDTSLSRALPQIADLGFETVELHTIDGTPVEGCTDEQLVDSKVLLDRYHMHVANIASTIFFDARLFPTDDLGDATTDYPCASGDIDDHLAHLRRAIDAAKVLGSPSVRVFPFRYPNNRPTPFGTAVDREAIEGHLRQALQVAREGDVTIVLENCPHTHLPKGKMTLEVVKAIDDPRLRLLWDPANSYRAVVDNVPERYRDTTLLEELYAILPFVTHVHLKNYRYDPEVQPKPFVHVPLGEGDIDFQALLGRLSERGYDGAVSLEPEVGREGSLKSMRTLVEMIGA